MGSGPNRVIVILFTEVEKKYQVCVRSISFPGSTPGAYSGDQSPWQELIERSHSPSRGDAMHLGSAPSDPLHKQGTGGWPGWALGMTSKLLKRTGADRVDRGNEAKERTQSMQWYNTLRVKPKLVSSSWSSLSFLSLFYLSVHTFLFLS